MNRRFSIGDLIEHTYRYAVRVEQSTKIYMTDEPQDIVAEPVVYIKDKETLLIEAEEGDMFIVRPLGKEIKDVPYRKTLANGTFKMPMEYIQKYTKLVN
jgi:hypothetical protein